MNLDQRRTFNSTRCIRNETRLEGFKVDERLSTPHGALGTGLVVGKLGMLRMHLSTPHGALGTTCSQLQVIFKCKLSTPHGALGTHGGGSTDLA